MTFRWRGVRLLPALVLVVAGCGYFDIDRDRPAYEVHNRTTQPVDVTYVEGASRTLIVDDLPADGYVPVNGVGRGECRDATLVAAGPNGAEIALFAGPVCDGTVWVIRDVDIVAPSASSASESRKPSAPTSAWGPLAVIPPQDGTDLVVTRGTLRVTDECVWLERGHEAVLLFWPADRTTWDPDDRAITFRNYDGTVRTTRDGMHVVLGGSGDSTAESGVSGADWAQQEEVWVIPPSLECPLETRWGVGVVE